MSTIFTEINKVLASVSGENTDDLTLDTDMANDLDQTPSSLFSFCLL
ncbi:hypothetical protein [Pseudovibrio sp. Tun.PSC04-5.I4]|nr:hypothetical protein [Pseudovibrio sp. Tun.PSC04-5.I4]SDR47053.1 hypothetical protein SAMN04515695_5723 [Pseudovibrio sp. Tun.PSC04-5.I4]